MNGRCDNDPLDVADDICDICGGEFCTTCVIWPRGQTKPPVCKTCALKNSGLRGTTKTERKASRRDAKKRREELIETRHERADGKFKFFDETDDFQLPTDLFTGSVQAPEETPNRRRISLGRKKHQESEGEARSEQTEMDTSWEQDVKGRAPGQGSGLPTGAVADFDTDPFAPVPDGEEGSADHEVEDSEFPDPALEDAEIVASMADPSTATALLERIRSESQLPPLPIYPATANESGFAFPQSAHDEEPTFAAGALDFDQNALDQRELAADAFRRDNQQTHVDPFSSGALHGDPFATHQGAFEHDPFGPIVAAPAGPQPHSLLPDIPTLSDPVVADPAVEPAIGLDDPFGAAESTAPTAVAPPPPPPPLPTPPPPLATNPAPRPLVSHVLPSGTAKPSSADVDANGNWIPPLLRGMAPKAERELETLPRRTSQLVDDGSIPAALRGVRS